MKHKFTRCLICKTPYMDIPEGYICRRCAETGKAGKRIAELEVALKSYIQAHDTDEMTLDRCECDLCQSARPLVRP